MADTPPALRPRATQARSRTTQERILQAAVAALVDGGYSGATTLRIQEIAGVTRGRLLHHYPSRDDLLVAAVAHLTEARMSDLAADVKWPSDPVERIDLIVDRMWETFRQPYFWASTELWLAARANDRLREALQAHERRLSAFILQKLATFFGDELVAHPAYPATRDLLITSMRGTAMTYTFRLFDAADDPHLQTWKDTARYALLNRSE